MDENLSSENISEAAGHKKLVKDSAQDVGPADRNKGIKPEHCADSHAPLQPTQSKSRKKPRLTKGQWVEFAGLVILMLWMWSELAGCHEFTRICFLALALITAYWAACYFLLKLFRGRIVPTCVSIALSIFTAGFAYNNSRSPTVRAWQPPARNALRLDLTLVTSHDFEHSSLLTNRSLISTNGARFNLFRTPYLFVPVSSNENSISLSFGVKNTFTGAVDNSELFVSLPRNMGLEYQDEQNWQRGIPFSDEEDDKQFKTMIWQFPRILLAGDADHAPLIKFPVRQGEIVPCAVMVASRDAPNRLFCFWLAQISAVITNKVMVIEPNQTNRPPNALL